MLQLRDWGGIFVQICTDANECADCGTFEVNAGGQWATLNCNRGGAVGNIIKLTNPRNVLQFCEMQNEGIGWDLLMIT